MKYLKRIRIEKARGLHDKSCGSCKDNIIKAQAQGRKTMWLITQGWHVYPNRKMAIDALRNMGLL